MIRVVGECDIFIICQSRYDRRLGDIHAAVLSKKYVLTLLDIWITINDNCECTYHMLRCIDLLYLFNTLDTCIARRDYCINLLTHIEMEREANITRKTMSDVSDHVGNIN